MSPGDIVSIIIIIVITMIFIGLIKLLQSILSNKSDVYNFERDHSEATHKPLYKGEPSQGEATFIGTSSNKKNVFIPNEAKHVFVCGTTGSGKTIALSNFINNTARNEYNNYFIGPKL